MYTTFIFFIFYYHQFFKIPGDEFFDRVDHDMDGRLTIVLTCFYKMIENNDNNTFPPQSLFFKVNRDSLIDTNKYMIDS